MFNSISKPTYDKETGEGFTTEFDFSNNQSNELTHIVDNLHICSLHVAKKYDCHDYYSINLTDKTSLQLTQIQSSQYPSGSVGFYHKSHKFDTIYQSF